MKFKSSILSLLLGTMIVLSSMFTFVRTAEAGYWIPAYQVEIAYTHWGIPHYAAFFSGTNGSNQYFDGPSGEPAGYDSWDWWGDGNFRLLLEKRWLFGFDCRNSLGIPIMCSDRSTGGFHHAYMAYH